MKDRIRGELKIGHRVIWFNDETGKCRLRVCNLDMEQLKQMKEGKLEFIDTIVKPKR